MESFETAKIFPAAAKWNYTNINQELPGRISADSELEQEALIAGGSEGGK